MASRATVATSMGSGPLHQEHLSAEFLGLALQVEFPNFASAGLGVHDQVRVRGRRLRGPLGHAPVRCVAGQRQAPGHAREQPRGGRRGRDPQQAGERVDDDHRDRRNDEDRERQPAPHPPLGKEKERRGQAHRRSPQAHRQHRDTPQASEDRHYHDRQAGEHETQPGEPAARARDLRARFHRHGRHQPRPSAGPSGSCPQSRRRQIMVLPTARSSHAEGPGTSPSRG